MGLHQGATRGVVGCMSASMATQVPDYIRSLVPYVPGKPIEETQREFKIRKVIKLASNENPLGPSPKALQVIRKGLGDLHRYPDAASFKLKAALSTHLGVSPELFMIGNGSNEIIDAIIRTFSVPGEAMVTSKAAFIAYKISAQAHGIQTLETPLTADLRFDLNAMAELVEKNSNVRTVFIANPNNPTGTYVKDLELRTFLQRMSQVRGGNVLVVLDYAYWEYVTVGDLPDPVSLFKEFQNVVVLRTFSKIYGLAGLRVGYAIGSAELISLMERVRNPFNVNSLGQAAALAALKDTDFVKQARKVNKEGMKFWENTFEELMIPYWKSQGNFILVDVSSPSGGKTGLEIYQECLKKGVIFRPVANYGLSHALRISIGTAAENRLAAKVLSAELGRAPSAVLKSGKAAKSKRKT